MFVRIGRPLRSRCPPFPVHILQQICPSPLSPVSSPLCSIICTLVSSTDRVFLVLASGPRSSRRSPDSPAGCCADSGTPYLVLSRRRPRKCPEPSRPTCRVLQLHKHLVSGPTHSAVCFIDEFTGCSGSCSGSRLDLWRKGCRAQQTKHELRM